MCVVGDLDAAGGWALGTSACKAAIRCCHSLGLANCLNASGTCTLFLQKEDNIY